MKSRLKQALNLKCLLWVSEQTGMSFSQLANTRPHLVLHVIAIIPNLCCWALPVFQCTLQTLWHHKVPTELPVPVFLKKIYFHKGRRGILNKSCTQLLLWNTHLKTDIGIVRFLLTGKCSVRSSVLHCWWCTLVRTQSLIITPSFMGNTLR